MNKNSAEGKICTFCEREALPGTDPAVCEEHLLSKNATVAADKEGESEEPTTLKELENRD